MLDRKDGAFITVLLVFVTLFIAFLAWKTITHVPLKCPKGESEMWSRDAGYFCASKGA